MPDFSIIVPTRDRPQLLAEAVGSVKAQTHADWELIIIDDGSQPPVGPDPDARVQVIRNERSTGPSLARNLGIEAARGEFVAFLDDDDAWRPERLAHALAAHRLGDVVVCGEGRVGSTTPNHDEAVAVKERVGSWILNQTTPPLGTTTIRRAICPSLDPSFRAVEDVDWWVRLSAVTDKVVMLGADDWLWRHHDGVRLGVGNDARVQGSRQLLEVHRTFFAANPRARAFRLRRIGLLLLEQGRPGGAATMAVKSFLAYPAARSLWLLVKSGRKAIGRILARGRDGGDL